MYTMAINYILLYDFDLYKELSFLFKKKLNNVETKTICINSKRKPKSRATEYKYLHIYKQ